MVFSFRQMDRRSAEEICYKWKYQGIYSFYNMAEDRDDLREFLDSENWHRYFAVLGERSLVGFSMY